MKKHLGRFVAVFWAGTALAAYVLLSPSGGAHSPAWGQGAEAFAPASAARATIEQWPVTAKLAAGVMIEKYGEPSRVSDTSVTWYGNEAWKRTVVYRDGWLDQSAVHHPDVLEQVISYSVPQDRFNDLASFDERLIIDGRTGELSFRSESEKTNFLAINLANEIAVRWKTSEEARAFAVQQMQLIDAGKKSAYTEGFTFEVKNELDPGPDGN
jgi:hypothetical protein